MYKGFFLLSENKAVKPNMEGCMCDCFLVKQISRGSPPPTHATPNVKLIATAFMSIYINYP